MRAAISTVFLLVVVGLNARRNESRRPNIVLLLTDDQDIQLGSMEFMPKTLKFLRQRGVEFENAFVSTPICCPSRTTILSGMFAHNHNVHTNNGNCGGREWREKFENSTFAVHVRNAGYRTAHFGKYLNEYDGSYVPPGWDHWAGLIRNSRFYNYTLNVNGRREKHGFDYSADYLTDLLTNYTQEWIEEHLQSKDDRPFLVVVSYPAPHGPEDPAPQYSTLFEGVDTHRTPAFNYAPNPDKQWLLQRTGKMESAHVFFTDLLHRRRLQTLQSVDDSVHSITKLLRLSNQLESTYFLYTSDHGFHAGQFGLLKGKSLPYEFDIRVPFFLRGPGLPKGISRSEVVGNVDLAPTMLAMAGVPTPAEMNGHSLLDLFDRKTEVPWRQAMLIERGKMPSKLHKIRDRLERQREDFGKSVRLDRHCAKAKFQGPCKAGQEWACEQTPAGRWRIRKCRRGGRCRCRTKRELRAATRQVEDELEEEFLQQQFEEELIESGQWHQGVFGEQLGDHHLSAARRKRREVDNQTNSLNVTCPLKSRAMCELPTNVTRKGWDRRKAKLDNKIQKLKDRLSAYKNIRKALKIAKPPPSPADDSCDCDRPTGRHPLRKSESVRGGKAEKLGNCSLPQMNCFVHSPDHWKTPPFWPPELGSFCQCQNANNNTYWCLRTLNETHDFLYCEFVTGFVSFYDLLEDPHQLTNVVFQLEAARLNQLNAQLLLLKSCRTAAECEHFASADWSLPLGTRSRKEEE
ncbi:hypothetical protein M3Y99_01756600 [Aphelenchoides fujianensis]|nr:hypothetical protein M3Y99_01756600 [Aphelenchoides fujianensis]